jgi:hypothetical protein
MKKQKQKPFFANFLEMQKTERNQVSGGTNQSSDTPVTTVITDTLVTLRYPSDSESSIPLCEGISLPSLEGSGG